MIEQAKGALMAVFELTEVEAFALLKWHSQHANLKLRELAARIVTGMTTGGVTGGARSRIETVLRNL